MQTQFLVVTIGLFKNLSESLRVEILFWQGINGIQRPVWGLTYSVEFLCLSLKQVFLSKAITLMITLLIFQILLIVEYIGESCTIPFKLPHRKLSFDCLRIKGLLVVTIIKLDHGLKWRPTILIFKRKVEICALSDDLAHGHVVAGGCVRAAHTQLLHLKLRLREQTLSLKISMGYIRICILLLIYMLHKSISLKVRVWLLIIESHVGLDYSLNIIR